MNKRKTILSLIMAAVMLLSVLPMAACSGNGNDGNTDKDGKATLKISAVELGYGVDWLKALIEEFEKETGCSVELVTKVGTLGINALSTELTSLASDSDLIFNKFGAFAQYVHQGEVTVKGGATYECLLADISDVWEASVDDGSAVTIADKMDANYEALFDMDGKYYGMPWAGGVIGIVRNTDVWNELGLKEEDIPLTTDSMFALCDKIKSEVSPFIFAVNENYYEGFAPVFMAQYEGSQNYGQFLNGIDPDGNVTEYVYTYDGALEAMKVLEKLLNQENGYHSNLSNLDFTLMQGQFLSGAALFCVNGSWLEREMQANYAGANVDFIRTPVISSIINKLDTVKDDAGLIEVIRYVDALDAGESAEKPWGVSDADIAAVAEARHYSFVAGGTDHQVVIPAYSKHTELAKEFLKFMYSDKGLNIYYRTLNGNMLPANPVNGFTAEDVDVSEFIKSSNLATAMGYSLNRDTMSKYFALTGLVTTFNNGGSAVKALYSGEKNASQVIDMNTKTIKNQWSTLKQYLGL